MTVNVCRAGSEKEANEMDVEESCGNAMQMTL